MEDIDKLLHVIRDLEYEDAKKHLKTHLNVFGEGIIERSWARAMRVSRIAKNNRNKRLSAFILENSEYDFSIPQIEFLRFFAAITDRIKDGCSRYDDVKTFAQELEDFMYLKIGKIKLDRRSLFQKNS